MRNLAYNDVRAGGGPARPFQDAGSKIRLFVAQRPDFWAVGLAGAAWVALIALSLASYLAEASGDHQHHHVDTNVMGSILSTTAHWQLMVVAMMVPVIAPSLRIVAFRSFWRRRHRAIAGYLVGYLAIWGVVGLVISAALAMAPSISNGWQNATTVAVFLLAGFWQFTRTKRKALMTCHRTMPLAPRGIRADGDCIAFGWRIGFSCCVSCWLLMLACTVAGHSLVALIVFAFLGYKERFSWRPNPKLSLLYIIGLLLFFGVMGTGAEVRGYLDSIL